MNNDLISRSELKKAIQNLYDETPDGIVKFGIEKSYDVIDNAPTVEPSLNLDNITDEEIEKFMIIWQKANSKGLLAINEERPKDKWGKWVINEIQCPNCLEYFLTDCYSTEDLNSCPCCGAKMKGGAE